MDLRSARWPYAAATMALAVYALLALCAYPALDDWCYAQAGRDMGVLPATGAYLHSWGGRWAAAPALYALGLLPDVALGYPLLVLAGFALAAWTLQRAYGWRTALIAGIPLLAWLPAPAEGPYWLSGGVTYLLPGILLVIAATLPQRRWSPAVRFALGAVAAGCGETACILGAAAITMACLLGDRRNLWILAGILVGGLAAFLAPGNAARWDGIAGGHRPDLIVAALAALPRTTGELLGLLPASWLCPAAPALAALALALATPMRRVGTSAALLILAGTLGGALLALLASNATVGCIEGRQANALWLYLVLGAAATGWAFLLPLGGRARLGLLLLWWALSWLQVAMLPTAWIGALLIAAVATAAAAWSAWSAWRSGKVNARAWLALSTLAAPGLLIACGDLWLAPQRRAEQWRRDAAVERLHDAGARRVRIPLLDPAHFPVTSSIGDLQSGHWATAGYAAWHRLDAVVVDPRLHEPRPDGLPTR